MPTGTVVTIPATDKTPAIPAYTVIPPGAKRGVVVIHEIFGRAPEIDRVGDRFAAAGYAAVVPDLFGAMGTLGCIRATMAALNTGEGKAVDVATVIRAWLCAQTGLGAADIGIIGFCFGGRDLVFGPNARKLEERSRAAGNPAEVHVFPDVGHSFLTDGDHPIARILSYPVLHIDYKPETAEVGWGKIMAFFDTHLGQA